ncbi:integrase/recombinase xerD homolog [Glandiceps talaboti]
MAAPIGYPAPVTNITSTMHHNVVTAPVVPPASLHLPYVDQSLLPMLANRGTPFQNIGTRGRTSSDDNSKPPESCELYLRQGSLTDCRTQQLVTQAVEYIHNSISKSTRRTYQTGQSIFHQFCSAHGRTMLPLTAPTVILFATSLAQRGLSYKTIKVYISAICHMHEEAGFANHITENVLLHRALQGIKRSSGEARRTRLPITISILRRLKGSLRTHPDLHPVDKLMLWSAFTIAFFGFLRVSEFTAPNPHSFDAQQSLLTRDITIGADLHVHLKASKTDPFRRGCTIMIASTSSSICAVRAYTKYQRASPTLPAHPAFKFQSGLLLTRHNLTIHLRRLLLQAGIEQAHLYATHSFRSGAATTAAEANLPDWLIKALGRWKSDAYQVYISTPKSLIKTVPRILSGAR